MYVFRKRAALFGVSPDPRALVARNQQLNYFPTTDWPFQYTSGSLQVNLDATYAGLSPAPDGEPQWAVLSCPGVGVSLFQITEAGESGPALYTLTSKTTYLKLALGLLLVNNALLLALEDFFAALTAFIVAIFSGSPAAITAAWDALVAAEPDIHKYTYRHAVAGSTPGSIGARHSQRDGIRAE